MTLVPFRIALILLALFVIRFSVRGFVCMSKGDFAPPCVHLATVFAFASTTLFFMLAALIGINDIWRAALLVCQGAALGLAWFAQRRRTTMKAQQFYSLYPHLDHALAISSLAAVDPAAAGRLADEARRLAANAAVRDNG